MNVKSQAQLSALPAPPLREYYSRVLAYIAIAASIAAGTYTQHFGYDILWMVPYALLYPHLAHHLSLRFKRDHPQRTVLSLLFIDALHSGCVVALLGLSVVPSLMSLLILLFSALVGSFVSKTRRKPSSGPTRFLWLFPGAFGPGIGTGVCPLHGASEPVPFA